MSLTDLDYFETFWFNPLSRFQGQRRILLFDRSFTSLVETVSDVPKFTLMISSSLHKFHCARLGNWLYNKSDILSWRLLWRRQESTNFWGCERLITVRWILIGAYGSSLAVFAAFFGLYKCDKIRRFNRMKYIHRILVRQILFIPIIPVYTVLIY